MSQLDQYRAVKVFFLENLQMIKDRHQKIKAEMSKYTGISDFDPANYSVDFIDAMFETIDIVNDEKIYKFFRQIDLLTYDQQKELAFPCLHVLLSSKFDIQILSLITKYPFENIEEWLKDLALAKLRSNEIYAWMTSEDPYPSESLNSREKIASFVAYFCFVEKFPSEGFEDIKIMNESKLEKTAKMLKNFAINTSECIDEFFLFSSKILKMNNKVNLIFLGTNTLNLFIGQVKSWDTFSKILKLAEHIEFEITIVESICKIIYESFDWNWNIILEFFSSTEKVLIFSYDYFKSRVKNSPEDKKYIDVMINVLEAVKIYMDKNKEQANIFLGNLRLDELIGDSISLNTFISPIEIIINTQLTNKNCLIDLVEAFFRNLYQVKNLSFEKARIHIPMLALYWHIDTVSLDSRKTHIIKYLESFLCQFEKIMEWNANEILNFFTATFSFIPDIKILFDPILQKHFLEWYQKQITLMERQMIEWNNSVGEDISVLSKLGVLAMNIKNLKIDGQDPLNDPDIGKFQNIINQYILLISEKKVHLLFTFYTEIEYYLQDFCINKITYEGSKNRETIAKFFICLIRNSLMDLFNSYLDILNNQQKSAESTNKASTECIDAESKENKFDESFGKINLESFIKSAIEGEQSIINDPFWNTYFDSRKFQVIQLGELCSSFLYKIVFGNEDNRFISRQFLASHLTRLFNGTIVEANTDFFIEGKQRAIKLYFSPPASLNDEQKNEFRVILNSSPVRGAFLSENIWNDNIEDLLNRAYFADIPDNLSGITVFGGTILMHQSLSQKNDFKACTRKITFIHEAAHAMRKYYEGSYNAIKKTQKSLSKDLKSGMPGNTKFNTELQDINKNEGGKIIENAIFGAFFTKINTAQIEYINKLSNWSQDSVPFRAEIEANGMKDSKTYDLARGAHYISGIRNGDCERY